MTGIQKLQSDFPQVFQCKSLLYVGATPSKWTHFLDIFKLADWEPTVLEIDVVNVNDLKSMGIKTIHGDVRNIRSLCGDKSFDVILWEDGPEHIYAGDFVSTIPQLITVAKRFVIMECPEGRRGHTVTGPMLERQLSEIYKNTFDKYGIKSYLLPQPTKPKDLRVLSVYVHE